MSKYCELVYVCQGKAFVILVLAMSLQRRKNLGDSTTDWR